MKVELALVIGFILGMTLLVQKIEVSMMNEFNKVQSNYQSAISKAAFFDREAP